ncbi:MAG: 6-phosphofructokinase [Clostridiales Family XIII bacterium]|jgi:6-phosphofructokinase 1|nr:6-phosphofructokinase [Clostridiales Family XIII bacterium]
MKRIGVLTSGGDAPGMNACIRAVVRTGISLDMEVFGIKRGYEGLMSGELEQLQSTSVSDIIQRGGTILKTARSEKFMTPGGFEMALNVIKTYRLDGLVIIGGNGSLTGAITLADAGVPVIGLPGTIDNDLPFTDETIGFTTAVNTVLSAISNIRDTSDAHERTTVIEVMGRECGDIAIMAGLTGGAEIILVPEEPLDIDRVCRILLDGKNRGKNSSIIIKAEGVDIASVKLDEVIEERTGLETKVVILGYIQRGGSPIARDRMIASAMGNEAVKLLNDGKKNKAIGIIGDKIAVHDLKRAMQMEKKPLTELHELAYTLSK